MTPCDRMIVKQEVEGSPTSCCSFLLQQLGTTSHLLLTRISQPPAPPAPSPALKLHPYLPTKQGVTYKSRGAKHTQYIQLVSHVFMVKLALFIMGLPDKRTQGVPRCSFGIIYDHLESFASVWDHLGPLRTIWDHSGPL